MQPTVIDVGILYLLGDQNRVWTVLLFIVLIFSYFREENIATFPQAVRTTMGKEDEMKSKFSHFDTLSLCMRFLGSFEEHGESSRGEGISPE